MNPSAPPPPPKRRRLVFHDFQQMLAEVHRLSDTGYHRTGQWSLTQICDHLQRFMHCSMTGFQGETAPWWMRAAGPFGLRIMLWSGWMPRGISAPEKFQPAPAATENPATLTLFYQTAQTLTHFPGPFAPHPLFGPLQPTHWHAIHRLHAAHHLSFLIPSNPAKENP